MKVIKKSINLEKTLKKLGDQLDLVVQDVNIVKHSDNVYVHKIDPSELTEPYISRDQDYRGSEHYPVIKKFYKRSIEVAYKPTRDYKYSISELAILRKLGQSPYILHFYGLSNVDNHEVMIFDWAEYGTLKELYNIYHIPWTRKIKIIRDICRGLAYLRSVNIFHYDIRCKSVFVSHNLDPKLGNFRCARRKEADFMPSSDIFHWMAPEQINHILSGKREILSQGNFSDPDDKKIQLEFIEIIGKVWKHVPHERIAIEKLHQKLEELTVTYPIPHNACVFLHKKMSNASDMNITNTLNSEFKRIPNEHSSLISLEEGIKLHRNKNYESAWKCFIENANLGNHTAKYWQGYYLNYGYGVVKQNIEEAKQLYKEAADSDHHDAKYRYVVLLINDLKKEENENNQKEFYAEILHYLKLAANSKHLDAMYHLGAIYTKGKLNVQQNRELGLEYLRVAAENNHPKAIKLLKELETYSQSEDPMDVEVLFP
ncbi:kinase-like protein [Gigaspora margarita]|uniref:Kinase-like protein n=1 Tax=Gigaspora margarita TaxID=4874 RepID=A0A8H4ALF6_GIGMA|nr:kinase-like protein [Gigaspora margarita]